MARTSTCQTRFQFLEDYGGAAPSDALYVIEMAETTFATPTWSIKPADSSQPQRSCKRQSAQSLKTFNALRGWRTRLSRVAAAKPGTDAAIQTLNQISPV